MDESSQSEQLKALLEAAIDAIITIDSDGVIQSVNRSACELFGYEIKDFVGKPVNSLMPEPWASAHEGYLKQYLETGEKKIIGIGREVSGLKSDGSVFPMHLSVCEYTVDGKRFFTGILHDRSVRKRIEDALHHSQKIEAIGQLTGGIAHDFNNLLTVITGNLELLEMRIKDENQKDLLREAMEAAELGADLTGRLLAFARRSILEPEVVNFNSLVRDVRPMLVRTLGENIKVETSLDQGVWNTLADQGQVENAILNLAVNARDAMPEGGRLYIETCNTRIDSEYAATEIGLAEGEYACICVSDTGHGMNEDVCANAFEPFFTTKGSGRGTGLGLSMVYGFAKQSGGHATIYSEPGLGTSVNIYLPRYSGDGNHKAAEADLVEEAYKGDGQVVLVVEDDERVRTVTEARIKALNYDVILAENGKQALDLLEGNQEIQLIFTDLVMPGEISGKDLVQIAKTRFPDVRTILTSGYAEELLNVGSFASLGIKFLRKPYRQHDLGQALAKAFAVD